MRGASVIVLLASFAAVAAENPAPEKVHSSLAFGLGVRQLGHEWEPASTQLGVALIDGDVTPKGSPVAISFGLSFSWSDSVPRVIADASPWEDDYNLASGTWDLTIGVRKYIRLSPRARLLLGFGGGVYTASEHGNYGFYTGGDPRSDSASGFGTYVEIGVRAALRGHSEWGLKVRKSFADTTLFGQPIDTGGIDVVLQFGGAW